VSIAPTYGGESACVSASAVIHWYLRMHRFLVVIEKADGNYLAYSRTSRAMSQQAGLENDNYHLVGPPRSAAG
jgi:hypothetical protein